jgi:hypothetical protein
MTFYTHIKPGNPFTPPQNINDLHFTEWRNCKDRDEALNLALHRFIKESGGASNKKRRVLTVYLRECLDLTIRGRILHSYKVELNPHESN